MDRRSFLRLLGTSALGFLLPVKGEVPSMRYGDRLAKILSDRASPELSELQRELNQLYDDQQVVRGWLQTGQSKIADSAIKFPFAPIYDEVLATNTATITVPIVGDYKHLMIMTHGRSTEVDEFDQLYIRFNSDTGTNYKFADRYSGGEEHFEAADHLLGGMLPGGQANASAGGGSVLWIPHYRATFWKACVGFMTWENNGLGQAEITPMCGFWQSTSAITSVTMVPAVGSISSGSIVSVYGIL